MQRPYAIRQWLPIIPMTWLIGILILPLVLFAILAWVTMDRPVPLQLEWNHNIVQLAPVPEVLPPPVIEEPVMLLEPAPVTSVAPVEFPPEYWRNLFLENRLETQAALAALPHIEGAVVKVAGLRNRTNISPNLIAFGNGNTAEDEKWLAHFLPFISSSPIIGNGENGIAVTIVTSPMPILMGNRQIAGVIFDLGDGRASLSELAYYFTVKYGGKAHAASKDLATGGNNTDYLLAGLVVNDKLCLLPEEMAGFLIHLTVADDILIVSTVDHDGWHQMAISSSMLSQCG